MISLKKNPEIYFLVDIAEKRSPRRGEAKIIDESATRKLEQVYGTSILARLHDSCLIREICADRVAALMSISAGRGI